MGMIRNSTESPWVIRQNQSNSSQIRLICLPYAGGGASVFHQWASLLNKKIDLLRIQLPGHETRIREPLLFHIDEVTDALYNELMPYIDRPFMVFGYSMGALIGFELIRKIYRLEKLLPTHFFVSSFRAPHLQPLAPKIYNLPERQFLDKLRRYGGVQDQVFAEKELMDLFLPILRADFNIIDTYVYEKAPRISCPITAFGGMQDQIVTNDLVEAWENETTGGFSSFYFSGGHFFINDYLQEIVNTINSEV